ncbi:hypothetical protein ACP70R_046955 [Stipagrostis hirtigluma subsp. patula]
MALTRGVLPLLLVLLAAATTGLQLQCQPDALADGVSLVCASTSRQPTERCCQELALAAGAGGASCLRRLAAEWPLVEAGLNATDLLTLHAACASPSGHGSFALPTAPGPATRMVPLLDDGSGCWTASLADDIERSCGSSSSSEQAKPAPSSLCCQDVALSVRMGAGGVPCFCRVAQLPSSAVDVPRIADLYAACRGLPAGAARDVLTRMCLAV